MGKVRLAVGGATIGALLLLFPASAWACSGLTSITPTSGRAGTVVTLTGSGFQCPGLGSVTFGGVTAGALTVNNDSEATVVAPAGSGTVDVTADIDGSLYTLPAAFTYITDNTGGSGDSGTGGSNTDDTDSRNLQTTMGGASNTAGTTSGQVITDAVGGAIDNAFSGGGSPTSGGTNGFALNFAATPPRSGAEAAADALAYAGDETGPLADPAPMRDWSLWADVRGSGFSRGDAFATKGGQVNLTAGLGRKLTPDLLIGLFGGYETYHYKTDSVGGRMTGNGGTIGGYAAARFADRWRADAMLGWTAVNYDAAVGAASGSTHGSRWLAAGGFTGSYRFGRATFEPSARVTALWEHDDGWTDSLGFAQAARHFAGGRVSVGDRLVLPWSSPVLAGISSYLGLYGDYRFASDDSVLPAGAPDIGIKDGLSARVTAGITAALASGLTLSVGGEYGGIGGGYDVWSAHARARLAF